MTSCIHCVLDTIHFRPCVLIFLIPLYYGVACSDTVAFKPFPVNWQGEKKANKKHSPESVMYFVLAQAQPPHDNTPSIFYTCIHLVHDFKHIAHKSKLTSRLDSWFLQQLGILCISCISCILIPLSDYIRLTQRLSFPFQMYGCTLHIVFSTQNQLSVHKHLYCWALTCLNHYMPKYLLGIGVY